MHLILSEFTIPNTVVKNLDIDIPSGAVVGVVGASGKTTFLRALYGEVKYDGIAMLNGKHIDNARQLIQYIPANSNDLFNPKKTIFQSMQDVTLIAGFNSAWFGELADFIPVKNCLSKKAANLTHDEIQFCVYFRALMFRPKLLLVDNFVSFSNLLDRYKFFEYVEKYCPNSVTIIVSPDPVTLMEKCTHFIVFLRSGMTMMRSKEDLQKMLDSIEGYIDYEMYKGATTSLCSAFLSRLLKA